MADGREAQGLSAWQADKISSFLASGASFRHLLKPHLALVALRTREDRRIVAARLMFASPTSSLSDKVFESETVKAIACYLPDSEVAEEFIRSFAVGRVRLHGEEFSFPSQDGGDIRGEFEPFHQGAGAQTRLPVLTMRGQVTAGLADSPLLDWELKSASPPYVSFEELLLEFGVPVPQGLGIFETFHALPVRIDGNRSHVKDTLASVALMTEHGIDPKEVRLGLVAIKAGEVAHRRSIEGVDLEWETGGEFPVGFIECEVPAGRTIQAIASLKGIAFHYWWLFDPEHITNPRKAVYEVTDPGCVVLRELLAHNPKGSARDLEFGVAWLFWMLGFGVAHLGSNRLTHDAVDLVVTTPSGNFALVECTTGVISTDKKVPNLLRRRALVLDKLAHSKHNATKVLPVLVTSCSREEVEHEIAPTQQRGVLVLTRRDLEDMLNQTSTLFDADEIYKRAEEQVASAAATEPTLPNLG